MRGIIALDIDGTITADRHGMTRNVIRYLTFLADEGWSLLFITGRPFKWGYETLQALPFRYYFAVQNGAIILEMPAKRVIAKKYLDRSIIPSMDQICHGGPSDFVIYGGYENKDICFYRPKRFSPSLLEYVQERTRVLEERWVALDSYDELDLIQFPSIKCFGIYPDAVSLARKIEEKLDLHVPIIRDPFDESYYVLQATHPQINKGQALKDLIALLNQPGIIIAAGDDNNDRLMLEAADIRVVMATAPKDLLELAHIVAPPASEEGIIIGLEQAIHPFGKNR